MDSNKVFTDEQLEKISLAAQQLAEAMRELWRVITELVIEALEKLRAAIRPFLRTEFARRLILWSRLTDIGLPRDLAYNIARIWPLKLLPKFIST